MRYRFLYHMFMKWFVPYSPMGAMGMAAVLLPTLFFLGNSLIVSRIDSDAWWGINAMQLIVQWWVSFFLLGYHRPLVVRQWFLANAVATALLAFQFFGLYGSLGKGS